MIHIFVLFHGFLLHLVELFLLRGRENAVDLVVCCLVNYFLFGALLVRGSLVLTLLVSTTDQARQVTEAANPEGSKGVD